MAQRCDKADCTQAAQYRYQCGEGHEGAEWVWGWALCPNHLIAELDVYRQEVAEMRDYGDVGETAPKLAVSPIAAECPHDGLFATGAPRYADAAAYAAWLAETRHCPTCGADVPNRDL